MNTFEYLFGRRTKRERQETMPGSGYYITCITPGRVGLLGKWEYIARCELVKLAYRFYKPRFDFRFKHFGLDDIEIDGIDHHDYPDYCDAYVSNAYWKDTGEELTEDESIYLNEKYREFCYAEVWEASLP